MRRILALTAAATILGGCGLRVEYRLETCADRGGRVVQTGTTWQAQPYIDPADGQVKVKQVQVPQWECVLPR